MAKILICSLGGGKNKIDGKYKTSLYSMGMKGQDGYKEYPETSFVGSVIVEHYDIDKTIYIGTNGSMWENLFEYYCNKYEKPFDEEYWQYLAEKVEAANINTSIENIDFTKFRTVFGDVLEIKITNYGTNQAEIFENFNTLVDLENILNDGDELYIDITHSFRSNALWMFLMMNYITDVIQKDVKINKILYGMFELSNENNNIAPVVDITALFELLNWIKAAQSFKNYGNSYQLIKLIDDIDIKNKLEYFSDAMNMNYVKSITENLSSIKKIIGKIESLKGPAKLIIPQIVKDFIEEFDGIEESYLLLIRLAKWHLKHKRYSLAYINIQEAILLYMKEVTDDLEYDIATEKIYQNTKAKKILVDLFHKVQNKRLSDSPGNNKLRKISEIYDHTLNVRNDISHSLGVRGAVQQEIKSLEKYCEGIEELFKDKKLLKNSLILLYNK